MLLKFILFFSLRLLLSAPLGHFCFLDLHVLHHCYFIHDSTAHHAVISFSVSQFIKFASIHVCLSLICIENVFGEVTMIGNSTNFVTVAVFLYYFLTVIERPLLALAYSTHWTPSQTFP